MVVTRKALAAELGISPSRISHYLKRGMPAVEGGLDREQCLDWIARNVIPQGGQNASKGASRVYNMRQTKRAAEEDALLDPPQERARRDRAATRRLELENAAREGQLMPADEVRTVWGRIIALIRTALLGMPSKLAARLAGKPAAEIQAILALEISDVLSALASPVIWRRDQKLNGNGAQISEDGALS